MQKNTYLKHGVSSTKEDVHAAIKNQNQGLFPGAFCKISEDFLGDLDFCNIMHADGAGTKSTLAYIAYKETGNADVFKGIAQDSLVMNLDDMLCVGAVDNFVVSNTIGRNAHRVGKEVLKAIVEGYDQLGKLLSDFGINCILSGGETADIGDLVGTIVVDSTVFTRMKREDVIDCSKISAGNVIVGLSSFGKSSYEEGENSGISSNGFTAARHLLLSSYYREKYPETFSSTLDKNDVYVGKYKLEDKLSKSSQTIGEALLSPTRTYLPVVKEILAKYKTNITGIIHSSGGGQTKCKHFGKGLHYIKDNLFPTPPIFRAIEDTQQMSKEEMYQVFNMGQRLEIYCDEKSAKRIIEISQSFSVEAKVIGRVENNTDKQTNKVTIIDNANHEFVY